jgi:hypothetical protein
MATHPKKIVIFIQLKIPIHFGASKTTCYLQLREAEGKEKEHNFSLQTAAIKALDTAIIFFLPNETENLSQSCRKTRGTASFFSLLTDWYQRIK